MTTEELDLAMALREKALQQESVVSPDTGEPLYEVGDPVRAILQAPQQAVHAPALSPRSRGCDRGRLASGALP